MRIGQLVTQKEAGAGLGLPRELDSPLHVQLQVTASPPLGCAQGRARQGLMEFRVRFGFVLLLALGCSSALAGAARAQEMPVPVDIQVSLLGKILEFDRGFAERANTEVVIGVVFQQRYRPSLLASLDVAEAVKAGLTVGGLPVRCVLIELEGRADLAGTMSDMGVDVLYVPPLRAVAISDITEVTRRIGVLTSTGMPEYVDNGVAIGIGLRGGRPQIIINREGAEQEGANFSSELLKLVRFTPGDHP